MTAKYILGIDPGLGGALALLCGDSIEVFDMPTHKITVNGKEKRLIDLYTLARFFDLHANHIKYAVVEDPNALPGQGVTSSFNFGTSCGIAQMAVASAFIPMHLVKPAKWKREMGLTNDKDASRRRASLLFPQHSAIWARSKDDGRAEAVLLAHYGIRFQLTNEGARHE